MLPVGSGRQVNEYRESKDLSLRSAAYDIAVNRVVEATTLRGF
ncbi:MAG: hypothetical protein WD601_09170 [Pseudohongiellaceae bacterium]